MCKCELKLISPCRSAQKIGFEKVISVIDEMVANLKTEQADDDHKLQAFRLFNHY